MSGNSNSRPPTREALAASSENSAMRLNQSRIDESAVCEFCGRTGAAEFGDHKICVDCYQSRCSCCCESECDTDE